MNRNIIIKKILKSNFFEKKFKFKNLKIILYKNRSFFKKMEEVNFIYFKLIIFNV